jgi:hypothetical protein
MMDSMGMPLTIFTENDSGGATCHSHRFSIALAASFRFNVGDSSLVVHALHLNPGADMMSNNTQIPAHAVLNRDRDEVRVPSPLGQPLLAYLSRRGLRGRLQTDRAGDLITLDGEPDMGRVRAILDDWERAAKSTSA